MIYSLKGLESHRENMKRYEKNLMNYVLFQLSESGFAFDKRTGYGGAFEIKVGKATYYYHAMYGTLKKEDMGIGAKSKSHNIPRCVILATLEKEQDGLEEVEIDEAIAYIKKVEEGK